MLPTSRQLPATRSCRSGRPTRHAARKPAAPRARLQVTALEDRLVPASLTGVSFVEQQGFPTPQATVFSSPTLFQDQLNQTWQNILSGSQLLNGKENETVTRMVSAPRLAFQMTPLVGSGVSMPMPFAPRRFVAARNPDPR